MIKIKSAVQADSQQASTSAVVLDLIGTMRSR